MLVARHEMRNIIAKLGVTRALRRSVPPAEDIGFVPGDQVLVFREKPEGVLGPCTVDNLIAKTVYVRTSKGDIKPFSYAQVKHFKPLQTYWKHQISSSKGLALKMFRT
jgi:hypothetical protein